MASHEYRVVGGSHDGTTLCCAGGMAPDSTIHVQMRDASKKELARDPAGRMELYRVDRDGKLYFMNVHMKDGKCITPEGEYEPSRFVDGKPAFDYLFVGGSHDGSLFSIPSAFEIGFAMSIDMRGEAGPLPGGKKEVYQLNPDRKFHYQNAVMRDGKQVAPLPQNPPGHEPE